MPHEHWPEGWTSLLQSNCGTNNLLRRMWGKIKYPLGVVMAKMLGRQGLIWSTTHQLLDPTKIGFGLKFLLLSETCYFLISFEEKNWSSTYKCSHRWSLFLSASVRFGRFGYLWTTAPKQPATRTNQSTTSENSNSAVGSSSQSIVNRHVLSFNPLFNKT